MDGMSAMDDAFSMFLSRVFFFFLTNKCRLFAHTNTGIVPRHDGCYLWTCVPWPWPAAGPMATAGTNRVWYMEIRVTKMFTKITSTNAILLPYLSKLSLIRKHLDSGRPIYNGFNDWTDEWSLPEAQTQSLLWSGAVSGGPAPGCPGLVVFSICQSRFPACQVCLCVARNIICIASSVIPPHQRRIVVRS